MIKSINEIDENCVNEVIEIEEDSIIGYKVAVDINNKPCIIELEIKNSKIVFDDKYNKYRTNKAFVKCIGKLYDKDYFSSIYNLECCICYYDGKDDENLLNENIINDNHFVQLMPCYHKICYIYHQTQF